MGNDILYFFTTLITSIMNDQNLGWFAGSEAILLFSNFLDITGLEWPIISGAVFLLIHVWKTWEQIRNDREQHNQEMQQDREKHDAQMQYEKEIHEKEMK